MTTEEKNAIVENVASPTRQFLRYLGQIDIVNIVEQHYARYGNTAPAYLTKQRMKEVADALNEHTEEGE